MLLLVLARAVHLPVAMVHVRVRWALRLVVASERLQLLLGHEVKGRLNATALTSELSQLVRPTVGSHHATAVHVLALVVMVVPIFTFELLVEVHGHVVHTTVVRHVPARRMHVVGVRLVAIIYGQRAVELADRHRWLLSPLR